MTEVGKLGAISRSTRLFALALLLSGCLGAAGSVASAIDWTGDVEITTAESPVTSATVAGGNIKVKGSGNLSITGSGTIEMKSGKTLTQEGGTITVAGGYGGIFVPGDAMGGYPRAGTLLKSDGTLNVGSGNNPALMEFDVVTLSGGNTVIGADKRDSTSPNDGSWVYGSALYGYKLDVTGGNVQVNKNGQLSGAYGKEDAKITLSGGTVTLSGVAGSEAILRASSAAKASSSTRSDYGVLEIKDNAVVDVKGNAAIVARETNFTGGQINVTSHLTVAGGAARGTGALLDSITTTSNFTQWGSFNFNGGAMTVSGNGVVDFITAGTTVTATNGSIAGTVNVLSSMPGSGTLSGVYTTNLAVNSGNGFSVTDLNVGVTGSASATNGITVNNGGILIVDNALVADASVADGALTIKSGGTANVDFFDVFEDKLVDGYLDSFTAQDGMEKKLFNGSEGKLILENTSGATITYNEAQVEQMKSLLGLDSSAELQLIGFTLGEEKISVNAADNNNGTSTVSSGDAGQLSNSSSVNEQAVINAGGNAANVPVETVIVDGSVSVDGLVINDSPVVDTLQVNNDIQLVGSGNNKSDGLITADTTDEVNIVAGNNVQLGLESGSIQGAGKVGDITLNTAKTPPNETATVTVVNGQYEAGVISSASANRDVAVDVIGVGNVNTSLEAGGINFANVNAANVTSVDVSNASLTLGSGSIVLNGNAASSVVADENAVISTTGNIVNAANVAATDGGEINVANITGVSTVATDGGDISTTGNLTMDNTQTGVFDIVDGDVDVGGTLQMSAQGTTASITGGTVTAGVLDLGSAGSVVYVGDEDKQGSLIASVADLKGGWIIADPDWQKPNGANDFNKASKVVIGEFATPGVTTGSIGQFRNSYFLYGTENTKWMADRVAEAGIWGTPGADNNNPITVAAGLFKPLRLNNGDSMILDGDVLVDSNKQLWKDGKPYVPPANTAYFGENSLLVVNGADKNIAAGTAALTASAGAQLYVDEGAKLYITNSQSGNTYQITSGFDGLNHGDGDIGINAWTGLNSKTDSRMLSVDVYAVDNDGDGSNVFADVTANNAYDVYGDRISEGAADTLNWVFGVDPNAPQPPLNDTSDSAPAGIRFVSRATSVDFNPFRDGAADVEGAAQMAALGGAPLNAFNIVRLTSNAVAQRFSFNSGMIGGASDTAFDCQPNNRVSIWGGGLYEHGRVSGMDVGPFEHGYRSNLAGGNVGVDFTFGDNVRVGVMGSFGGGKNKSKSGDFAYTENDFDYQTVRGYAGWSMCNFSLLLDGGFTNVKNKLTQASFDGGLAATAKVHAWDVGVTAEYKAATGFIDVIPHAGIRYEGINTRGHNVRYAGGDDIMNVGSDTQHLLTIPVGVSLAKNINFCNGWNLSPYADVGARFAVGDRTYKTNTSFGDTPRYGYRTKMIDAVAFDGAVGINVNNGRFFSGVNYNITHSKNQTTHGFWANVGMSF